MGELLDYLIYVMLLAVWDQRSSFSMLMLKWVDKWIMKWGVLIESSDFFNLCFSEDYPGGTWLGDDSNPEMRVRCPVSPGDMLHISSNCRTAEKMALTLLDYLFHREVQAMSNLSGQGKHGKKQLDPLMIYGIRCESCHLLDFCAFLEDVLVLLFNDFTLTHESVQCFSIHHQCMICVEFIVYQSNAHKSSLSQGLLNPYPLGSVNELYENFPHFTLPPLQSGIELNTETGCTLYSHGELQQHALIIAHKR